jgi:hypothetical protein
MKLYRCEPLKIFGATLNWRLGFDIRVQHCFFSMKLKGLLYQFFCAIGCVAENSSVREVARETWPQLSSMGNMFQKPWRSVNRKRKLGEDFLSNIVNLVYRTFIGTNNTPINLTVFESYDFSPLFSNQLSHFLAMQGLLINVMLWT